MSANRAPLALLALGLSGLAVGAPFLTTWGAIPVAVAFLAGIAALAWPGTLPPLPRRLAWVVTLGAPLIASFAFTIHVAAPNVVTAGQKASAREVLLAVARAAYCWLIAPGGKSNCSSTRGTAI